MHINCLKCSKTNSKDKTTPAWNQKTSWNPLLTLQNIYFCLYHVHVNRTVQTPLWGNKKVAQNSIQKSGNSRIKVTQATLILTPLHMHFYNTALQYTIAFHFSNSITYRRKLITANANLSCCTCWWLFIQGGSRSSCSISCCNSELISLKI